MCELLSRVGFPVNAVVEPAEVPSNQPLHQQQMASAATMRPVEVKKEEHCEDDLFWGFGTQMPSFLLSLGGHWPSFLHSIPHCPGPFLQHYH